MTTIAYRDGVLAADSQVTSINNAPAGSVKKIGALRSGAWWAFSGPLQYAEAYVEWANGDQRAAPPVREDGVFILFLPDGRVREWWGDGWLEMQAEQFAWGSGERIAAAAMMAGADPEKAVEIAAVLDPDTGGAVSVLRRMP